MATAVSTEKKIWTEAELEALPEDGYIHEVVDGELVMSPKNNSIHGKISAQLLSALFTFVASGKLGAVWDSSTGFWMHNRNCRAPDISFIGKERLKALGFKTTDRSFIPGAPDLAVEILSPNNTRAEINERLRDFFSSGTQIAWIINPDTECVEVCYALDKRKLLCPGDDLDGEHLLPGFRYPIAELFKGWDWE
jgi:Uma2 family endonuclease